MKTSYFFFWYTAVVYLVLSLFGCSDNLITSPPAQITPLYHLDSLVIRTSQTGTLNVSNIAICDSQFACPVNVSFSASVNGTANGDNKYVQVSYSKDNQINFAFAKYNDAINGSHSFTINPELVSGSFDNINFYIKILENYSPNAFIKLTNINVTK